MQRITTFLTFKKDGKEAVDFYTSIFKNSKIHHSMALPGVGTLLHASFSLDGQEFMAMDGGDHFDFAQGHSLFVNCNDQEEVDYYWEKLSEGGEEQPCGWIRDKYGVSWQVVPKQLGELMTGPDQEAAGRVMQAMLKMSKIDIAALEAAAEGK